MTLEAVAPADGTAPSGWHGEGRSGAPAWTVPGVWQPPSVAVQKTRAWQRASAAVITRGPGEGYWRGDQHIIVLPLTDYEDATFHADGAAARRIPDAAPQTVAFRPAGIGARTTISAPQYTFAAIFHDPGIYRDLAAEVSVPINPADLEPKLAFEDPRTARLISTLVEEISGSLDPLLVNALHIALALQIVRHFHGPALRPLPAGRLSRERLQRVLDYIETHLGSLTLDELAAIACLSPYHFSRCFARSMGVGPHRYVMGRRVAHARRLLLRTDMSLIDIAAAAGFDSQASFTFRFSRELGVSPGRLRRERV